MIYVCFVSICNVVPCPEIIKPYKNTTILLNQAANLYCLALSFGALTYDWVKIGSSLSTTAMNSYVTKKFLYFDQDVITYIPNVSSSDEGWYCCKATNECGTTKKCVWLEVNGKF